MKWVIVVISFANGQPCPIEGQLLYSFDFDAYDGQGYGEFGFDLDKAKMFDSVVDAWTFWNTVSKVKPKRDHDGQPNRPFTSTSVIISPITERELNGLHTNRRTKPHH